MTEIINSMDSMNNSIVNNMYRYGNYYECLENNMFIDIFQAQGFLGLLLFLFLLINLFNKSQNSSFYKFNFSLDIRSLTITLLFIFLCTHNSGIIFHPLTVFPLLFVQDFLQSSKPFEKKKEYLA